MTRQEDIHCDFLGNDRIWPPNLAPPHFIEALFQVLERLPEDAYDEVDARVSFVVEVPGFIAYNVPFNPAYLPCAGSLEVRFDTIVVFHQALTLPQAALMGLLAHELAHTLVNKRDYSADEQAADDLAQQWGSPLNWMPCDPSNRRPEPSLHPLICNFWRF